MSIPALLGRVRQCFETLPEHRQRGRVGYPLADALMSAVAMFSLKDATLYAFDELRNDPVRQHNLRQLYGIQQAPCDTQMRSILDQVGPLCARRLCWSIRNCRQGVLETYRFMGKYLISVDGTAFTAPATWSVRACCCKQHRNGEESYYHQLLGAVLVHPDQSTVLPLFPEAITRRDGSEKNDCEHNASQRLLPAVRQAFPRLEMIVLQDALACNGPHIRHLKAQRFSFIITSKPRSNSLLLNTVLAGLDDGSTPEFEQTDEQGVIRGYRFRNAVPLNHEHADLKVNFIDYWEKHPNGTTFLYACVTDLPLTADNVAAIVRAGRSRWKIENETFNTLKNQGYHLEHNYGHGKKHLSTVFATLMMLTFLIDQVQEACCRYFQEAWHSFRTRKFLWERIRSHFALSLIDSWESLYAAIIWRTDPSTTPVWQDSG
ncbi:MAG: hypothetical protein R3E95_17910 [Thiolinea sp.]